jgi:hypothetical protein
MGRARNRTAESWAARTETALAGVNFLSALPSAGVQYADRTISCTAACIDPSQYAYYVEAVLWKPAATSDLTLSALRVHLFVSDRG